MEQKDKPSMDELNRLVSFYSEELAKDISEIKLFNTEEVAAKLSTRIKFILFDVSKRLSHETEHRYAALKNKLLKPGLVSHEYSKTQIALGELKKELKEKNRQFHQYRSVTEYDAFKKYIAEKYGKEIIREWADVQDGYMELCRSEAKRLQEATHVRNRLKNHN